MAMKRKNRKKEFSRVKRKLKNNFLIEEKLLLEDEILSKRNLPKFKKRTTTRSSSSRELDCNNNEVDLGWDCNGIGSWHSDGCMETGCYSIETTFMWPQSQELSGQIPSTIGNLINLKELILSNNSLSGNVLPPEIGNLTNLEYLYLDENQVTELPPEIGQLTSLTQLHLDDNGLTGIPPEIGNLTNLTNLNLSNNQLTGEIPPEIGNLSNLTNLYLYENQLTGQIPPEIGNLTNLTNLSLRNNQLTGEIPSWIENLTNLSDLRLYNNQLTGEIPSSIGNLTNLYFLSLDNNQLTGEIPPEICNINYVYVSNNQLCPDYPGCISQSDINSQDTSGCTGDDCTVDNYPNPSFFTSCAAECDADYTKFDVNDDGDVNVLDLVQLTNWVLNNNLNLGWGSLTDNPCLIWAADFNNDGLVNVVDLVGMVNHIIATDGNPLDVCTEHTDCNPLHYCHSGWDGFIYAPRFCVSSEYVGGGGSGMPGYCNFSTCGLGDGHCGNDAQCAGDLTCGSNNCSFNNINGFDGEYDCCEEAPPNVYSCCSGPCHVYTDTSTQLQNFCNLTDVVECQTASECNHGFTADSDVCSGLDMDYGWTDWQVNPPPSDNQWTTGILAEMCCYPSTTYGTEGCNCPGDDEMEDCNGNCFPSVWLGDDECDEGQYQYGGNLIYLNCEEHNCDNGDCGDWNGSVCVSDDTGGSGQCDTVISDEDGDYNCDDIIVYVDYTMTCEDLEMDTLYGTGACLGCDCVEGQTYGCSDPEALNYDESADIDEIPSLCEYCFGHPLQFGNALPGMACDTGNGLCNGVIDCLGICTEIPLYDIDSCIEQWACHEFAWSFTMCPAPPPQVSCGDFCWDSWDVYNFGVQVAGQDQCGVFNWFYWCSCSEWCTPGLDCCPGFDSAICCPNGDVGG